MTKRIILIQEIPPSLRLANGVKRSDRSADKFTSFLISSRREKRKTLILLAISLRYMHYQGVSGRFRRIK
jgi:hypothetical protein